MRPRRATTQSRAVGRLTAIEGQNGGEVTLSGHPVAVAPGNSGTLACSEHVAHQGHGLDWQFGGHTAFYSAFQYEAA
ncbi:hypothetical protein [Halomonas halmophila]|uniref:hypothetical protein n=1 Tax=Halomonas halmophila TaxID=252 RepID=UPI001580A5A4|nr:hypothetical protein [Halomonas halmophila]